MWRFLDVDRIDGLYSAAVFESIARHVGSGRVPETIIFWRVSTPVVYLGFHQYVEDEVLADFCHENNIVIVRRILGGGCGFCDEDQILYSVIGREDGIMPRDILNTYRKVLGGIVHALGSFGEMSEIEPARNGVYTHGRKISGNAQGRLEGAVMVNGSLLLDFDFELMDRVLRNPVKNLHPVASAREGMITLSELGITDISAVKNHLRQGFEKALGIRTYEAKLTASEIELAEVLLGKYKRADWLYRMDIKRARRRDKSI